MADKVKKEGIERAAEYAAKRRNKNSNKED